MKRVLALLLLGISLSGCAAAIAGAGVVATGVTIANNGRAAIRANMDTRCQRWFVTEGDVYLYQGLAPTGTNINWNNFAAIQAEVNAYCIHAWKWPGKNADDMVVNETGAVQNMIAGKH